MLINFLKLSDPDTTFLLFFHIMLQKAGAFLHILTVRGVGIFSQTSNFDIRHPTQNSLNGQEREIDSLADFFSSTAIHWDFSVCTGETYRGY